jgi:hypothetical protein
MGEDSVGVFGDWGLFLGLRNDDTANGQTCVFSELLNRVP